MNQIEKYLKENGANVRVVRNYETRTFEVSILGVKVEVRFPSYIEQELNKGGRRLELIALFFEFFYENYDLYSYYKFKGINKTSKEMFPSLNDKEILLFEKFIQNFEKAKIDLRHIYELVFEYREEE